MKWNERICRAVPPLREKLLPKPEPDRLLVELAEVQMQLEQARQAFDTLTNLDLIEACIYRIESLEVQCNYLIKQAREAGVRNTELLRPALPMAATEA